MERGTTSARSGNNGEWFLEAVGKAIEAPPEPVPLPQSQPDAVETGPGVTPDAATAESPVPAAETTTEAVGQMWRSTGTQDPLEDWEPEDLDRYVSRKRNFRWTTWIMLAVVVGVVAAAVLLSPRLVERQAAAEATDYGLALSELRATLPATQQILRAMTEPDTPTDDLSNLVPDLSRLQAAADDLVAVSTRPLPTPLPLIPSDALDDLEPSRDAMARLGSTATALAGRLADGIEYRSFVDGFLDAGELSVSVATPEIAAVQERIALSYADATSVLARLPGDEVFADHRTALSDAVEAHREWESAYISALRNGDASAATDLIEERATLLVTLRNSLIPALATLRSELDRAILELDRELVETINALP